MCNSDIIEVLDEKYSPVFLFFSICWGSNRGYDKGYLIENVMVSEPINVIM